MKIFQNAKESEIQNTSDPNILDKECSACTNILEKTKTS